MIRLPDLEQWKKISMASLKHRLDGSAARMTYDSEAELDNHQLRRVLSETSQIEDLDKNSLDKI